MVLNFDPYVCLNSFKVQNVVKNFDRNREIETILREIIVFTKTTFSFTYRSNYKKKIQLANLATFSRNKNS